MHIVLVNGSPRKGVTRALLEELADRLHAGGASAELLDFGDYRVGACRGCFACVLKGGRCPAGDDGAEELWARIAAADGVVLGAPVYALGLPGGFKNFMDRIAWHAHRPEFHDKPALAVATTAGMGTGEVLRQLGWFETAGLRMVGGLGVQVFPYGQPSEPALAKRRRQVEAGADALLKRLNRGGWKRPKLVRVVQFHGLRLNCQFEGSSYVADREWYAGKDYFPGGRPGRLQTVLGKLVYRIGWSQLKKAVRTEG